MQTRATPWTVLARWLLAMAMAISLVLSSPEAWAGALTLRITDTQGRPLPDAVVFLESREARAALRASGAADAAGAAAAITQADKRFDPAVSVVPVGTAVEFPNRDTVRHHVYSFSSAKKFELKLYVGTPAKPVVFDQPGIAVLGCNIHDQMVAWVVIVDTPWYGRSDAQGRVQLPQVPAGHYRLRTWHASLPVGDGPADQALVVGTAAQQVQVSLVGAQP